MAYDPKGARKARRQVRRLKRKLRSMRQANQYDPTAPLTGVGLRRERRAAQRLQFGEETRALRQERADQAQTRADRERYYDQYKAALDASAKAVQVNNAANVGAVQQRTDQAYQQDLSSLAERDRVASEAAAKLGRAPVRSEEGARAVAAQRAQGNQSAATLREKGQADVRYTTLRSANSVLAKAEDQSRLGKRADKLAAARRDLAQRKGAFRVDFNRQARKDEREWKAVQQEFGLKRRGQNLEYGNTKADRALERQKLSAQKIIARLYSSADRATARAQVRVAKLQLQKGKITKNQYRRIVNIYKGLPGGDGNGNGNGAGPNGQGSGKNGKLLPWEKDKVSDAVHSIRKHDDEGPGGTSPAARRYWINRMVDAGVPRRLAIIAWRRYAKTHPSSGRPDTAGNPNVGGQ